MKEIYKKPVLKLTEFDSEDVITTSGEIIDKHNAYSTLKLLDGSGDREAPPGWY